MSQIIIDGVTYDKNNLSKYASDLITSIQTADAELNRLKIQTSLVETARAVYARELTAALANQVQLSSDSGVIKIE